MFVLESKYQTYVKALSTLASKHIPAGRNSHVWCSFIVLLLCFLVVVPSAYAQEPDVYKKYNEYMKEKKTIDSLKALGKYRTEDNPEDYRLDALDLSFGVSGVGAAATYWVPNRSRTYASGNLSHTAVGRSWFVSLGSLHSFQLLPNRFGLIWGATYSRVELNGQAFVSDYNYGFNGLTNGANPLYEGASDPNLYRSSVTNMRNYTTSSTQTLDFLGFSMGVNKQVAKWVTIGASLGAGFGGSVTEYKFSYEATNSVGLDAPIRYGRRGTAAILFLNPEVYANCLNYLFVSVSNTTALSFEGSFWGNGVYGDIRVQSGLRIPVASFGSNVRYIRNNF